MKLAVVGSINMDMTVTAERIPLKGETLRADRISRIPGGKGDNQAVAMARLGAEEEKRAARSAGNAMVLMAIFGITFIVMVTVFLTTMPKVFGVNSEAITYARTYTR